MADLPTALSQMMMFGGATGFGGNLQGAVNQIGQINAGNRQAAMVNAQRDYERSQVNQERNSRDKKFSMLFKTLIGDPYGMVDRVDANGRNQGAEKTGYSPLMMALVNMMGGSSGMGQGVMPSQYGGMGSMPNVTGAAYFPSMSNQPIGGQQSFRNPWLS